MALDKGAVALILGFGFIILLPTLIKKVGCQQNEDLNPHSSTGTPSLISRQPPFQGKAYRVDIPNWGIPSQATAADIVRFEREELGNVMEVAPDLLKELEKYRHSDVIWVTKNPEDAENYLSEGMTRADITEFPFMEGARIITEDGFGGFLVLFGDAAPKATGNPGITERGARYGFLQLNEAEYAEAVGSGRYPEPKRYEELTSYFAEPHEPGWKGISLAEMFPTRYQDLRSRGVPDKLSPSEVKTVIEEKRVPYGRGVEPGTH